MRRNLIVTTLLTFCLTATLFMVTTTRSQTEQYDPWSDINDDGRLDILDVVKITAQYGAAGTPLNKASIGYDSGWIDIEEKAGQSITLQHGLGSMDVMVDITGKTKEDGGVHQKHIGGEDYTAELGWNKTYGGTNIDSAACVVQTVDRGYALAGSTGFFDYEDFWLVKTDSNGTAQHGLFKYGLAWIDSTLDSITLYRGTDDIYTGTTSEYAFGNQNKPHKHPLSLFLILLTRSLVGLGRGSVQIVLLSER